MKLATVKLYYNDTGANFMDINLLVYASHLGDSVLEAMRGIILQNAGAQQIADQVHLVEFCAVFTLALTCDRDQDTRESGEAEWSAGYGFI